MDILDLIWRDLQNEINSLRASVAQIEQRTERAEYTDGVPAYAYASLPTDGLADGTAYVTMVWVTNGRKAGEGAGAGTGILAIYQSSTATWKRVGDYLDVTI